MGKLFALLALAVFVAPAAHAQPGGKGANKGGNHGANNGARVGKTAFLLNVHAFDKCPGGDFTGSNRHAIAVLNGHSGTAASSAAKVNKIFLQAGSQFAVQDGNACDQNGAYFELPVSSANCANCAGSALPAPTFVEYEVRARLVGKPGGATKITSCEEMIGIDPVIAAAVQTQKDYSWRDVRFGERFVEMYTEHGGGRLTVDYGRSADREPDVAHRTPDKDVHGRLANLRRRRAHRDAPSARDRGRGCIVSP